MIYMIVSSHLLSVFCNFHRHIGAIISLTNSTNASGGFADAFHPIDAPPSSSSSTASYAHLTPAILATHHSGMF